LIEKDLQNEAKKINKKEDDYTDKDEKIILVETYNLIIIKFGNIDYKSKIKFLIKSKFKKSRKNSEIKKLKILGGLGSFTSSIAFDWYR